MLNIDKLSDPLLSANSITKMFGGAVGITDVSISFYPNEIVGIIGSNGAGKSTLVNTLCGNLRPDRGDVTFAGQNVSQLKACDRTRLGLIRTFQEPRLLDDRLVVTNIVCGSRIYRRKPRRDRYAMAMEAGATAGLSRDQMLVPASSLAPSDRRRTEVARALAAQPLMLLLDEPSAGFNRQEVAEFATMLLGLKDRVQGIALVSHDLFLVSLVCSRVVVMDAGRILAEDTLVNLGADPDIQRAIPWLRIALAGDTQHDTSVLSQRFGR